MQRKLALYKKILEIRDSSSYNLFINLYFNRSKIIYKHLFSNIRGVTQCFWNFGSFNKIFHVEAYKYNAAMCPTGAIRAPYIFVRRRLIVIERIILSKQR